MLTIYIKGRDEAEMMTIDEMKQLLQASLPPKRYKHSVHVYETALELAKSHKLPEEKIAICALLHDCGREVVSKESAAKADALGIAIDDVERNQPILLHAKLGVYYAQTKYGVTDKEILAGIFDGRTECFALYAVGLCRTDGDREDRHQKYDHEGFVRKYPE